MFYSFHLHGQTSGFRRKIKSYGTIWVGVISCNLKWLANPILGGIGIDDRDKRILVGGV